MKLTIRLIKMVEIIWIDVPTIEIAIPFIFCVSEESCDKREPAEFSALSKKERLNLKYFSNSCFLSLLVNLSPIITRR